MRFVGANREVSRLSGVRVDRIRFGSYVAAGALSGVGAIVYIAGIGGFTPSTSNVQLLPVFAAVFLGTAVIQPGRFNPIGTWIGIYFMQTGITGLEQLGLATWISDVFYGGVLVVAVTISTLLHRRTRLSCANRVQRGRTRSSQPAIVSEGQEVRYALAEAASSGGPGFLISFGGGCGGDRLCTGPPVRPQAAA